jgi:PAS domain S-box-containing protein
MRAATLRPKFSNRGRLVVVLWNVVRTPRPDGYDDALIGSALRELIEAIPAHLWTASPDGAVDFFNERWLKYSGRTLPSLLGWKWQSALHPDDVGSFIAHWREALITGQPFDREIRVRRADGEYRWWLIRNEPKHGDSGQIVKWYGAGFDIDDRKHAEKVARQAEDAIRDRIEKELREVIDDIPVLCAGIWADGRVEFFNRQTLDYYGLSAEEMVGFNWKNVVHPDDLPGHLVKLYAALSAGQSLEAETRTRRADGQYRWLLHRIVPKYNEKGEVVKFYGTSVDIEDRKRAEEAVLEQRVLERTRIARELHDTLLQNFQGTLLLFDTAVKLLDEGEVKDRLSAALYRAERAIVDGRDAIRGLRIGPEAADDVEVAIKRLGESLAASDGGPKPAGFYMTTQGVPLVLLPTVRHEVFSIASESLRNAFQHAAATRVQLELRYSGENFQLSVTDDGKGIDPVILDRGSPEGHFGLSGIRERAKMINGHLTLWSEPGRGTKVELDIPHQYAYGSK